VALVAGCARLPSTPAAAEHPAIQMRATLKGDAGGAGHWPHAQWWKQAGQPLLDQAMRTALRDNPDVEVADARLRAAQAVTRTTGALRLPHLDAQAGMTREYFSAQGLHSLVNGRHVVYTEIDPLRLSQHLDLWGRDRARILAAHGRQQMAAAEAAQVRLQVAQQVGMEYFALYGAASTLDLARRVATDTREMLQLQKSRLGVGLSDQRRLHRLVADLAQAERQVAARRAALAVARARLAAFAGQGPDWAGGLRVTQLAPLPPLPLPGRLPLHLAARRPDVVAARWGVEAAAQGVRAAREAFYPDVNLRLLAGWNSISLGDLFDPANLAHAIGPVVTLPLFEGGRLRGRYRQRQALYDEARGRYRRALLDAVREVVETLAERKRVRTEIAQQQRRCAALEQEQDLEQGAFRAGLVNRLKLLQAQRDVDQARLALADLRAQDGELWVRLETVLGGGFGKGEHA
jgi:efflux transporter, outer membrane factor (OMF) lipoprotein, NodT family